MREATSASRSGSRGAFSSCSRIRPSSATSARSGALLPSSVAIRTKYGATSWGGAAGSRSPPSRQKSRHSLALRGLNFPAPGAGKGGWRLGSSRGRTSEDEHGIAEGVEAVPLLDGEPVEAAGLVDSRERHHEGEQRGARQVEVRQQRVDAPELEAGRDEQLGAAGERPTAREGLEHAHRRGTDGEDAFHRLDPLPRLRLALVALAVDPVLLEPLFRDRPERVEADVERDVRRIEPIEQLRRAV